MAAEKTTEPNVKPIPKAVPVKGVEGGKEIPQEGGKKSIQQTPAQKLETAKKELENRGNELREAQGEKTQEELFRDWPSPLVKRPGSDVLSNPAELPRNKVASSAVLENTEKSFSQALTAKHNADIDASVSGKALKDIDVSAREKAYTEKIDSVIKYDTIPDLDKKKQETRKKLEDEAFKKLPAAEQDQKIQETIIAEQAHFLVQEVERFKRLPLEDQKKPENLKKLSDVSENQLGIKDSPNLVTKLLDDAATKNQIIKNIQEIGLILSGINLERGLGAEISEKQRANLEEYIKVIGEDFRLADLPLDIRQRLIFEGVDKSSDILKNIDENTIPEKMQRDIARTKREIFRHKENETDDQYKVRVDNDLKKQTGLRMKDVSKDAIKLHPLIRFLADLLAPFGAMMDGPSGDFWRNYMKQNGTREQQEKWASNIGDSYGKEGETITPRNRESHQKNILNYKGCENHRDLGQVSVMKQNRGKYVQVAERLAQKTNGKKHIPWEVIAAIHYREGDMDFHTYLHNGNKLGRPTTDVPAGITFPDNEEGWINAAVDALNRESYLENMTTDTLGGLANIAEYSEKYNGPAFRNQGKNSPYVWAGAQGISVAGLIKIDHGPITNQADKRLGIMPIVMELSGHTQNGVLTDKYKGLSSSTDSPEEKSSLPPEVQWFKDNQGRPYVYGAGGELKTGWDCMTSTHAALGLDYTQKYASDFNKNYIDSKNESNNLWNVSMASALYSGNIGSANSETRDGIIRKQSNGYYGEKSGDTTNMEYYIEENVMKRVSDAPGGMVNVGDRGNLVHYSKTKKGIPGIVEDIKTRLKPGESAMMGGTGNGTNKGGHEWLVHNDNGNLQVYDATSSGNQGVAGTGTDLAEYLNNNRRSQYGNEAIILAKKP